MPCWERREVTLDLNAADTVLLARAMRALGYANVAEVTGGRIRFTTSDGFAGSFEAGKITVDRQALLSRDPNVLKRAYSREAITAATQRFGWKSTTDEITGKVVATKRAF